MNLIRAALFLLGLLLVVLLSVANRQPVEVGLWPLASTLTAPLYWVILATLAVGVVLGGFSAWWSRRASRAELRRLRRKVRAIEYQERLRQEAEEHRLAQEARRKTEALALTPASRGGVTGALVPVRAEVLAPLPVTAQG